MPNAQLHFEASATDVDTVPFSMSFQAGTMESDDALEFDETVDGTGFFGRPVRWITKDRES